jgi:hypothetical protein
MCYHLATAIEITKKNRVKSCLISHHFDEKSRDYKQRTVAGLLNAFVLPSAL